EAALYNAGARVARGDILLFSEGHVVATAGVVRQVANYFDSHAVAAANLPGGHVSSTPMAKLDQLLFEQECGDRRALGDWREVGLRGFAVRASVFRALGTFDESYLRTAESAFAIRMVETGQPIGRVPNATVLHGNIRSLGSLA